MQAFEQLLEAVEYSEEMDIPWQDQFSDLSEAQSILTKARKQQLEEYDVARLAIAMGEDPPNTIEEVEEVKKYCFSELRRILKTSR